MERVCYKKYKQLNTDELVEFYRYLNLLRRNKRNERGIGDSCFIPVMTAIISSVILQQFIELFKTGIESSSKTEKLLEAMILDVITLVSISLLGIFLYKFLWPMIKSLYEEKRKLNFYDDFIEIIKEIIDSRGSKDSEKGELSI